MDNLTWLSNWFAAQCDGEWESDYGLTLESVNNPGWALGIDLDGTGLNPSAFLPIAQQRSATDWVEAKVMDGVFHGGCSPQNLNELVAVFREFVEGTPVKGNRDRQRPQGGGGGGGGRPGRGGGGGGGGGRGGRGGRGGPKRGPGR